VFGERASLLASIEKMSAFFHEHESKQNTNQIGLFDNAEGEVHGSKFELEDVEPLNYEDKIFEERNVIGMSIS